MLQGKFGYGGGQVGLKTNVSSNDTDKNKFNLSRLWNMKTNFLFWPHVLTSNHLITLEKSAQLSQIDIQKGDLTKM